MNPTESRRLRQSARQLRSTQPARSLEASEALLDAGERDAETLRLAAGALIQLRRGAEAAPLLEELRQLTPGDAGVLAELVACHKAGADMTALRRLREQVEALPHRRLDLLLLKIRLSNLLDEHQHCAGLCRELLRLRPQEPEYWCMLGWHQQCCGELEEAADSYRRALSLEPHHTRAHYALSQVVRAEAGASDHLDAALASLQDAPERSPRDRASMHAAIGKALEDLGEYPRAFEQFRTGAATVRAAEPYHAGHDSEVLESAAAWARAQVARASSQRGPAGCDDPAPIFIVGMPRTGSTLLDRMLSSHSAVHSAGELLCFQAAARRQLMEEGKGNSFEALFDRAESAPDFRTVGESYLALAAGARDPACPHFTDKLPMNYFFLGLIALALPRARILHTTREPMDSCFSMYKQLFGEGFYRFSYDLEDLAEHYAAYRRLMTAWHDLFPGRILDVPYESLVAAPSATLEQVLSHCGLPWEDACLQPQLNRAPVDTASSAQVRQPIYRSAVGRWQRYGDELAPLAQALRERGVE